MFDNTTDSISTGPWDRYAFTLGAVLLAALFAVPFITQNRYYIGIVFTTLMFITLATSWNMLSGFTGYISFGHAAFFGIGAYTCAILFGDYGTSMFVAILIAGVVTVILSLPVATATIRLSDTYFAIMMLVFSQLLLNAAENFGSLTGGVQGFILPVGNTLQTTYLLMVALTAVSVLTTYLIARSHLGLALTAIRDDEEAADALGLNTTKYKVFAFSASAIYPGFAGGIAAIYWAYIDPSTVFNVILSGDMMIMSVLGGMGTVVGPILGASIINPLTTETQAAYPFLHGIVFGTLFMVLVLSMPDGVVPTFQRSGYRRRLVEALPSRLVPSGALSAESPSPDTPSPAQAGDLSEEEGDD